MTTSRRSRLPTLKVTPFPVLLPIMSRVVFIDWHGVLSMDGFWSSILERESHPYQPSLSLESKKLFKDRADLVRAWMRGELQAPQIVRQLNVDLDRRTRPDFLLRRLYADCRKIRTGSAI